MPMSPRNLVKPARHAFSKEIGASCQFSYQGQAVIAAAHDVSKGHISVICPMGQNLPHPGDLIEDFTLSLLGRSFALPCLRLDKIRSHTEEETQLLIFASDDVEATSRLWEISYLLRNRPGEIAEIQYTDSTLPKVPGRGNYTEEARQERLAFAREMTSAPLAEVEHTRLDPRKLVSNIEAFIGSVEIPVGLAGPLYIKGEHANGLYCAPMATTEGALVASVTRGATAISRSGGVTVRVLGQRMLRVPAFVFETLDQALFFVAWIQDHFQELSQEIRKYSNFAKLSELQAHTYGRAVNVYFVYETGDAAGQNMTTTCTWQACQWVMEQIKRFDGLTIERFMIDSNLSNDKKVSYQSFLKGRGSRVMAECVLTRDVCEKILKIDPKQLVRTFQYASNMAAASGSIGINVNVANVIAAIFTACGQDIACVHESSLALMYLELTEENDVYCSMMMPTLVVGTVGGGTNLPQQRECLELMDCAGPGNAHKLAEIICAYCLALDISTASAIAADHFARAHEKLGRNRPVNWMKLSDLTAEFFDTSIRKTGLCDFRVTRVEEVQVENKGSSIVTELTSHKINKLVGHFPYRLYDAQGAAIDVMVKIKPLDDEVILTINSLAAMCNPRLAQEFNKFKNQIGFKGCHIRELGVMTQRDERIQRYLPRIYGAWVDFEREAFILIEERLQGLELMDTADDTYAWGPEHIRAALSGIAEAQSIWYGREDELRKQRWLVEFPSLQGMLEKQRLWELLGVHAREEFPEWFSENDLAIYRRTVHAIDRWWADLEKMPRTLIHNDFNPRNIAFRRDPAGKLMLCAYDWELATLHLPQHDLVELLLFTMFDPIQPEEVESYIEFHRQELERHVGKPIDAKEWRYGFRLALWDLLVNRLAMYFMGHTFRHYKFMERVYRTLRALLQMEGTPE